VLQAPTADFVFHLLLIQTYPVAMIQM